MAVPEYLAKWPAIEQILEVEMVVWKSGKETCSLLLGICITARDSAVWPYGNQDAEPNGNAGAPSQMAWYRTNLRGGDGGVEVRQRDV
jgi:hypothetical protein